MNLKEGTAIQHRDNPRWKGRIVKDLNPNKPASGFYLVFTPSGDVRRMIKTLVRKNSR